MATDTLTKKQALFVQEFMLDMNGTQAALRSGYSARTANRIASENLSKPVIIDALQKAMSERAERTQISADSVLREFAKIAFVSISDIVTWGEDGKAMKVKASSELAPEVLAAIMEVSESTTATGTKTIKVKLHPKLEALQNLGKHLQLFPSMTRHEGGIDVTHRVEESEGPDLVSWLIEKGHIDLVREFAHSDDAVDEPALAALPEPQQTVDATFNEVGDIDA